MLSGNFVHCYFPTGLELDKQKSQLQDIQQFWSLFIGMSQFGGSKPL